MIKTNVMNINRWEDCVTVSFPSFDATGVVKHAFSTRFGGVSRGIYESMNLSFSLGDEEENVTENYRRFAASLGIDYKDLVFSKQTHTDNIRIVTAEDLGKGIIKERDYDNIDALITNVSGVPLCTHYADCVPIYFLDPEKKVAAMAHAGWRGTAAEIARKTAEKMIETFGCDPKDILAGIAPSISKCCFEVDDPVMDKMKLIDGINLASAYQDKGNGKYMLDLKHVNKMILMKAGIPESNITVSDICTCCQSDAFHSHRATGGKRGSLAGIIQLI